MQTEFKFRNLDSSDTLKSYATDKLGKLQKYLKAPLQAQITFAIEAHLHCVDVSLSAGGEHHMGRAEEEDMYASIDVVVDKLHRQINRTNEQHKNYRRGPQPDGGPGE
jgi:putative sigma-54 modulation protein